ncbi:isocitrate/isopropylmalate dehydrogenase family protein [Nonomuraea typhae]|uniref:isocitrate/isopropylmalate dehydrogenase family protein n=1 Tax=Nonomuraea typhae TaxID=2603600 RepID=UPI0012F98566|nr:isocitrate/isopropylmalate family dehydrogenase [Nonomuraea typhae]
MTKHHIALIPGDGIGAEVLPAARRVLDAVGDFSYQEFDWSCERLAREGAMMPPDGLERLRDHDAILLGAVGAPEVPDHVSLWGLLIPIRRGFQQYVNLRPIRARGIDMVVVRENVEGEYSEIGGRLGRGTPDELAVQESVFTRKGVGRVAAYAFALAGRRRGLLTSATKSNGIVHTMPFWDEIVAEQAAAHPAVRWDQEHVDALAAKFVLDPGRFDVVVASNLFGDILSDLAAAVAGSIGLAPSANLNPERAFPSMFEPVHGSAPDIAGQGVANPTGAIGSAVLMLEHLGLDEAARRVTDALSKTSARTPDLGGSATTEEFTSRLLSLL